jgi:RNA polymerase primary sigma factor
MNIIPKTNTLEFDNNIVVRTIEANQPLTIPDYFWHSDFSYDINRILSCLTEKESTVIQLLYGINCEVVEMTDLAKRTGISRSRIREIKEKAIRRMRHSSRANILKKYLGGYETYN